MTTGFNVWIRDGEEEEPRHLFTHPVCGFPRGPLHTVHDGLPHPRTSKEITKGGR